MGYIDTNSKIVNDISSPDVNSNSTTINPINATTTPAYTSLLQTNQYANNNQIEELDLTDLYNENNAIEDAFAKEAAFMHDMDETNAHMFEPAIGFLKGLGNSLTEAACNLESNVESLVSTYASAFATGPAALAATSAVTLTGFISGTGKMIENIVDGGMYLQNQGEHLVENAIGNVVGLLNEDLGNTIKEVSDQRLEEAKEIIATDWVAKANDWFYENTGIGKLINENSTLKYNSELSNRIQNTVKAVDEIIVATALTLATGVPVPVILGTGFASGAGKTAEATYQSDNKSFIPEDLAILASGGLTSLSWLAKGKLGAGFSDIASRAGTIGVGNTISGISKEVVNKSFWYDALKGGLTGANGATNLVQSGMMTADKAIPLLTGEKELTPETLGELASYYAVAVGLNITEDALSDYVKSYDISEVLEVEAGSIKKEINIDNDLESSSELTFEKKARSYIENIKGELDSKDPYDRAILLLNAEMELNPEDPDYISRIILLRDFSRKAKEANYIKKEDVYYNEFKELLNKMDSIIDNKISYPDKILTHSKIKYVQWVEEVENAKYEDNIYGITFKSRTPEGLAELMDYFKKSIKSVGVQGTYFEEVLSSKGVIITDISSGPTKTSYHQHGIVHFDQETIKNNSIGVFFHELGHFIDFDENDAEKSVFNSVLEKIRSESYLESDYCRKYVEDFEQIVEKSCDIVDDIMPEIKETVTKKIQSNIKNWEEIPDKLKERILKEEISKERQRLIDREIRKTGTDTISDIIDAMTRGKFFEENNFYGHGSKYYLSREDRAYKEMLAHVSDLYNRGKLDLLDKYFPSYVKKELVDSYERLIGIQSLKEKFASYRFLQDYEDGKGSFDLGLLNYANSIVPAKYGLRDLEVEGLTDSEDVRLKVRHMDKVTIDKYLSIPSTRKRILDRIRTITDNENGQGSFDKLLGKYLTGECELDSFPEENSIRRFIKSLTEDELYDLRKNIEIEW